MEQEKHLWAELEASAFTARHLHLLEPSGRESSWICCSVIISMSNAALSFHCRIEFRKNQAGEERSYPSIYLREGRRGRGRRNNKVSSQRFLSYSLSLLIQNIILFYWCSTREHILCSGDSLHFPENTMERVSQCKVTDLPPD